MQAATAQKTRSAKNRRKAKENFCLINFGSLAIGSAHKKLLNHFQTRDIVSKSFCARLDKYRPEMFIGSMSKGNVSSLALNIGV